MSHRRRLAAILVGLALAALRLVAACSAIDPVPPDPHEDDPSDPEALRNNPDASDATVTP